MLPTPANICLAAQSVATGENINQRYKKINQIKPIFSTEL
jgi:hypothetical protein